MAKKKGGKKGNSTKRYSKPKGKPAFSGASMRRNASAVTETKRKRTPRSEPLPGMEQARDRTLDNLCESINDVRTTLNEAKGEEEGLKTSALKRMQAREVQVYKHAGVELSRVPGGEELRVRLTKDRDEAVVPSPQKRQAAQPEPEPEIETDAAREAAGLDYDKHAGDEVH